MEVRVKRIGRQIRRTFTGKESGAAFPMVLAFLVIGAIIIAPLLGFMITGIRAGEASERRTQEFYSADAGIEYAIHQLQYGGLLDEDYVWCCNPLWLTESGPLTVNNDLVDVWVEDLGEQLRFKITSTATDNVTGSATTVVTHVVPDMGYQGNFFANGVTAVGDITIKGDINGDVECGGTLTLSPGTVLNGDVKCYRLDNFGTINGNVTCNVLNNKGVVNGTVKYYSEPILSLGTINPGPPVRLTYEPNLGFIQEIWPSETSLTSYYLTQVIPDEDNPYDPATYYPFTIVNSCGDIPGIPAAALGVYTGYDSKKGDPRDLSIDTKNPACAVRLTTTVFVTGDFSVTPNTKLDLNGQTIYVLGTATFSPGSLLTGSGVIIAVGQVSFQPSIVTGGESGTNGVIVYYNGSSWVREDNPSLGDLNDVWGITGAAVYAVGNGGSVLRYTGGNWVGLTTPLSSLATKPNLNGVWCNEASGDIFAVGDAGTTMWYDADAAGWTYQVHGSANLNDVWGSVSDNVVYAVGDSGAAWRWEEGDWTAMTNDLVLNLNAVWGTEGEDPDVVYAVGDGGTIRRCTDGQTWLTYSSGTLRQLNAIWGVSSSDFFVVGEQGTIRRWNGSVWTAMSVNDFIRPELRGIFGAPAGDVYAVGEQGTVIRYSGSGTVWTHIVQDPANPLPGMTIPTTRNLNGVWACASDSVYAVGQAMKDFVFVQSVDDFVKHLPNGDFWGSIAGKGECTLQPGGQLQAPSDLGRVNFPSYRYMRMESYVIDQH
jgi:hypothetical protein